MAEWLGGETHRIEEGLRVVVAPNPSPMTRHGTNTFLLGCGDVTVLDPGPALPGHLAAILAALHPGERVARILVSHAHLDHSPLARPLADHSGAQILAFGGARDGRSARMAALDMAGGGEGLDLTFQPDERLRHGDRIEGGGLALQVVHTPGHLGGHLCFGWENRLFTGDHVMGWAPSLVSPPDGDMTDYLASLDLLAAGPWQKGLPAHGAPIADLRARCRELRLHRKAREAAILAALAPGAARIDALADCVYAGTDPALMPAARRNLLAHLVDLETKCLIAATPRPHPDAVFSLVRKG